MRSIGFPTALLIVVSISPAMADITVSFREAAPRDSIVLENRAGCTLRGLGVALDLDPSSARLIFDTVPGGPGENVAQPAILRAGTADATLSPVSDGDSRATLTIDRFPAEARIVMTMDLDDREPSGPMGSQMIASSEIAGAMLTLTGSGIPTVTATFNPSGQALLKTTACARRS